MKVELETAWAETIPWVCLIRETSCCSPDHDHSPMAYDECAFPGCPELLVPDEVCYGITGLSRQPSGHEPWVCWRHVRPEPVRLANEETTPDGP
jgi:hypothetical protein